jgi:hypothetical protein
VEGTIRHPVAGEAWEYSIVISILDEQEREISRQVVSVGVLNTDEQRTVRRGVVLFKPSSDEPSKESSGAAAG